MPVITRNQRKSNMNRIVETISNSPVNLVKDLMAPTTYSNVVETKSSFIMIMKNLLFRCQQALGQENRMRIALEIFEKVNKSLALRIAEDGLNTWIKFIASVFSKTSDFIYDMNNGTYCEVDRNILENFFDQVLQARNYTLDIIKNYNGPVVDLIINNQKNEISKLESIKLLRDIPRVDYTGMDMIEPEDKNDGITDIWADLTIYEDPDYLPEEDEEDEDEVEDRRKWAKIHPELSVKEKAELKHHLSQSVDNHRARRNIDRVNYAGMDMNEEDEGQLHIAKRWFEDGKVKYIWKSYSLSQANEIGDEDYVDE